MRLIVSAGLVLLLAVCAFPQDTLYTEDFHDGSINLDWFTPWAGGDEIGVTYMEDNPSGDHWVGQLGNTGSGGGVGTALAGDINMTDYAIEAQVFCTVNTGAYHGIVARWDTTSGYNYYYLRTDFDADQRLQLREYPGTSGMGSTILSWEGNNIPGGVPTEDGWHTMKMEVVGNNIWAWWNGELLSGCPVQNNSHTNGSFGIYIFNFSGAAETLCDDIIVTGESGPQLFDLVPMENVFLDVDSEPAYYRAREGETRYFQLLWQALQGEETSPPFAISLDLDGSPLQTFMVGSVEPNSEHVNTSDAWTATLGEHELVWNIDPNGAVEESNTENNTLTVPFLVLPTTAFDFQLDSVYIVNAADSSLIEDNNLFPEQSVRFVMQWSVPFGEGFSNIFNIELNVDGLMVYHESIPGVQNGDEITTYSNPITIEEQGMHFYTWMIDTENDEDELSESNNSMLDGFFVNESDVRERDTSVIPETSTLLSTWPNPFNPATKITFQVNSASPVKLSVFDLLGREVDVLHNGPLSPGIHEASWNASGFASGIYFAVLQTNGIVQTSRLIYMR